MQASFISLKGMPVLLLTTISFFSQQCGPWLVFVLAFNAYARVQLPLFFRKVNLTEAQCEISPTTMDSVTVFIRTVLLCPNPQYEELFLLHPFHSSLVWQPLQAEPSKPSGNAGGAEAFAPAPARLCAAMCCCMLPVKCQAPFPLNRDGKCLAPWENWHIPKTVFSDFHYFFLFLYWQAIRTLWSVKQTNLVSLRYHCLISLPLPLAWRWQPCSSNGSKHTAKLLQFTAHNIYAEFYIYFKLLLNENHSLMIMWSRDPIPCGKARRTMIFFLL